MHPTHRQFELFLRTDRVLRKREVVTYLRRIPGLRHKLRPEDVEVLDPANIALHQRAQPSLTSRSVFAESSNLTQLRIGCRIDHQILELSSR